MPRARSSCLVLVLLLGAAVVARAAPSHDFALFSAVSRDSAPKIEAALKAGANPNCRHHDMKKITPLILAAISGRGTSTAKLLAAGADTSLFGEDGITAMHAAAYHGQWGVVQLLINHGDDPDQLSQDGYTPLFRACWGKEQHHTDAVNILVSAGVDFELKRNGKLPVAMAGRKETVDLLRAYRDGRRSPSPPTIGTPTPTSPRHSDPLYEL